MSRRYGKSLRIRHATLFAVAAIALIVAVGWTLEMRWQQLRDDLRRDWRNSLAERLEEDWRNQFAEVERRTGLARQWIERDASRVTALHEAGRRQLALAEGAAATAGLDALTILRPDGQILTSWPRPERAGLKDGETPAADLPTTYARRPVDRWPASPGSRFEGAWIEHRTTARIAGEPVALVAARRWNLAGASALPAQTVSLEFVDLADDREDAPAEAGRRFVHPLRSTISSGDATEASGPALRVEVRPPGLYAVTWIGSGLPGRELRALLWPWLAPIGLVFVPLCALLGWWSGGRTEAPVKRLIDAVDAIAAGDADYTFPQASSDEFEELAEAFSRLHRSLEEQKAKTRVTERIAAWRDVARRVAHDVKNPLAPIRLTVQNLTRARSKAPDRFPQMFEEGSRTILEEVERLSRLVGEFSEFARMPEARPQPMDLVESVRETVALYAGDPSVQLAFNSEMNRFPIRADRDQMSRAFGNLVKNALESGGEQDGVRKVEVSIGAVEGGAEVRIEDRGSGFTSDTLDRVFEPYISTKAGGTGLGLAITMRIVSEHGGRIQARNRPDGGASLNVFLPRDPHGAIA